MTPCNQLLRQGIVQYCNNLQTYDAAKCAYVNTPQISNLIDMTAVIAKQDFLYGPPQTVIPTPAPTLSPTSLFIPTSASSSASDAITFKLDGNEYNYYEDVVSSIVSSMGYNISSYDVLDNSTIVVTAATEEE